MQNDEQLGQSMRDRRKPSQESDEFWLTAKRLHGAYPEHTERGGKWLLFVPTTDIDEVWARIHTATEEGLLGGESKVATARPSPLAQNPNIRLICVYTYDSNDEADVKRVRAKLRDLGFTAKISYKEDQATREGKYAGSNRGRVAKFYE